MLTIMPATFNLKLIDGNAILKGSDWYIEVTLVDRVNSVDTPINISGFTGICQIRENANSETIIASPKFTILDASGGTFSLSLEEDETAAIKTTGNTYKDVSKYQYELKIIDGNDNHYRTLQGYIEISPSIIEEV